ncbi:MAG TPA: SDR family NAD(P)-dependent oxidoreductase [Acidimicrobiales bacterium]|jgi:NAD(P)-dependent dehydrogenase (short-subunit alcohol dehydrogenase family)|nr:SDR family NAD(P)-dependent oxidoreductase [Acidimicrobiales bacterium]
MDQFEGRCAVVTGGASGIGLAMAAAFAGEGMRVVIADRDDETARGSADELASSSGAEVMAAHVDVADPDSVETLRAAVAERFGPVHVLCNNAGVAARRPLVETTPEDWEWIFGVNVFGVVNGLRAFLPGMIRATGERHVVNTGSMSSLRVGVMGSQTMYTASKFALLGLSEALRQELDPHGIGLTVLLPGPVATDLARTSELGRPRWARPPGGNQAPVSAPGRAPVDWMDPAEVGPLVVRAIRANRPFAVTHPQLWPQVAAVHHVVAEAFSDPPGTP